MLTIYKHEIESHISFMNLSNPPFKDIVILSRIYCASLRNFPNLTSLSIYLAPTHALFYDIPVAVLHKISHYEFFKRLRGLEINIKSPRTGERWETPQDTFATLCVEDIEFLRTEVGRDELYNHNTFPAPPALETFTISSGESRENVVSQWITRGEISIAERDAGRILSVPNEKRLDIGTLDTTATGIPLPVVFFQKSALARTLKVLKINAGMFRTLPLLQKLNVADRTVDFDGGPYESLEELVIGVRGTEHGYLQTLEGISWWFPNLRVLNVTALQSYHCSMRTTDTGYSNLSSLSKLTRVTFPWPFDWDDWEGMIIVGPRDLEESVLDALDDPWAGMPALEYVDFVDWLKEKGEERDICRIFGRTGDRKPRWEVRSEEVPDIFHELEAFRQN
ncbi:hypothetical protein TWF694_003293 [Orbilia ellipsospora]|uniref:Uncharacterized protein n=1 Tax=Orbilia ellipsospora TaxID=2528407 RepID=A0AAV9X772_9PEZI